MINPNMAAAEDRNAVPVRYGSESEMSRGISHVRVSPWLTVVNVETMDYNVCHVLNGNARPTGDMDASATAVDGFEGIHNQFFFQSNHHIASEDDPEGFILDYGVTESSWFRVNWIIVAGVSDDVDLAVATANGVFAESNPTVG